MQTFSLFCSCGSGGQVVSVLAFYSDDPSLTPVHSLQLLFSSLLENSPLRNQFRYFRVRHFWRAPLNPNQNIYSPSSRRLIVALTDAMQTTTTTNKRRLRLRRRRQNDVKNDVFVAVWMSFGASQKTTYFRRQKFRRRRQCDQRERENLSSKNYYCNQWPIL